MTRSAHKFTAYMQTVFIIFVLLLLFENFFARAYKNDHQYRRHQHAHPQQQQQRCSQRLESALEQARRRNLQPKTSRSFENYPQSPYDIYHSFYGQQNFADADDDFYYNNNNAARRSHDYASLDYFEQFKRRPHKLSTTANVDVEDLHVKVPQGASARWVAVEKCNYSTENATLDTRLIFPDLTLSGKIIMQPTGGKCHMILRLRRAGIEFRTVPIGLAFENSDGLKRMGSASVRTDSHFAEPGFITVFAHSCHGPTGVKYRQNSKRRFFTNQPAPDISLSQPQMIWGNKFANNADEHIRQTDVFENPVNLRGDKNLDWSLNRAFKSQQRESRSLPVKRESAHSDEMQFNDDILSINDEQFDDFVQNDASYFAQTFRDNDENSDLTPADRDSVDVAFTRELEKLFSMGVRSLLTTYMQRALQPAIKETLMENMGYTISYG